MDALLDALRLTVIGMGVVFSALIALSLLMYALPSLTGGGGTKAKSAPEAQQASVAAESKASVVESAATTNHGGLSPAVVAVIATAVAAYLGQGPENLNIISIRRTPASLGSWATAARRESIQN